MKHMREKDSDAGRKTGFVFVEIFYFWFFLTALSLEYFCS